MDVLASYSIFQELQLVHDTGYFSALPSLEETWQQVNDLNYLCKSCGGGGDAGAALVWASGLSFWFVLSPPSTTTPFFFFWAVCCLKCFFGDKSSAFTSPPTP